VTTATRRGIREWLESAPNGILRAAAFDTRIDKRWVPGSAARGIVLQLHKLGATLVTGPQSFRVVGTAGPLAAGELDRARKWGETLASSVTGTDRPPVSRPPVSR
jgi:hypothetical protein